MSLKVITSPSVYLVGRQRGDEWELQRFIERETDAPSWRTDSTSHGEGLCEVAGRCCYSSFKNPRPGGNKAYLSHILDVGHGSVLEHAVWNFIFTGISRSLSHELVRHRAGWAYCLAGDVEVYSGSKLNGVFDGVKKRWTMKQLWEWSQDKKRKGRLKLIKVRCFDGESFVPAKLKAVRASGVKPILRVRLEDGKEIRCSVDHRFMTPDGWKAVGDLRVGDSLGTNGQKVYKSKDWLRQKYWNAGLSQEEIGCLAGVGPDCIRRWVRKHGLQKPLGSWTVGVSPWNKGKSYTAGWHHTESTKQLLREQKTGEKNYAWRGDEASEQAGRLRAQRMYAERPCEECPNPKGHRHHKDRNTLNNAPDNIEFLCASCHQKKHLREDGSARLLTVKWVKVSAILPDGEEMTYDLEVDHPSHNFVANGFVTHNSQLSQRYVDEGDVAFVCPPELLPLKELADARERQGTQEALLAVREKLAPYFLWYDACHMSLSYYRQVAEYLLKQDAHRGELSATERRKVVRQTARSVLPNCAETKIFCTANARALRHFLEMRCSRHADVEIRRLAGKVWEVLAAECPNLFGDYRKQDLPDGSFELVTEHRKV